MGLGQVGTKSVNTPDKQSEPSEELSVASKAEVSCSVGLHSSLGSQ